jgi:hypothetical protein
VLHLRSSTLEVVRILRFAQSIREIVAKSKIGKLLNVYDDGVRNEQKQKNRLSAVSLSGGDVDRLQLQWHRFV